VPRDGTPENLLILASENPGGAVVEGDVRIDGRAHVLITGLEVHGKIKFNDAEGIVIRGVTIETPDDGIVSYGTGVKNALILDNHIHGPTLWREAALGVDGDNLGEGVQITGPGNVVAWNQVSGFRDCLSLLEDDEAVEQVSVDFYGNDLAVCADDAIEADFAMGNVRVYRNRIRDSFMGISSQPSLGGPTYFTRNALYNVLYQAFKLQRSSVGDVGFHNTVVKSGDAFSVNTSDVFSRAWFRNNLFLGGPGATYNGYDSGPGDVMMLPSADASCSFDYDGFGALGRDELAGRVGEVRFENLDQLRSSTTEAHAVQVGLDVFDAAVQFPEDPFAAPATPSLLLAEASAAVDQGEPLANVNDGFEGAAPDLGAFELGAEEPEYGPGMGARPGSEPSGGDAGEPAAGGSSSGGRADTGGSNTGGRSAGGGANSGGRTTTGGRASGDVAGGASGAGSPAVPAKPSDPEDSGDDGCSCSMPASGTEHAAWAAVLGAASLAVRRRRRNG
jgi:MYXO-CTERM domain-containing protein